MIRKENPVTKDLDIRPQSVPRAENGLTLPLTKYLESSALAMHQASVAMELELLAKKTDQFGWDKDRGTLLHDMMVNDWIDTLQDFPLGEIRAAIAAALDAKIGAVADGKNIKMPNNREVLFQIKKARDLFLLSKPRVADVEQSKEPPVTKEQAQKIMEEYGFAVKRMGGSYDEQDQA